MSIPIVAPLRLLECSSNDAHSRFGLRFAQMVDVADRDAPLYGLFAGLQLPRPRLRRRGGALALHARGRRRGRLTRPWPRFSILRGKRRCHSLRGIAGRPPRAPFSSLRALPRGWQEKPNSKTSAWGLPPLKVLPFGSSARDGQRGVGPDPTMGVCQSHQRHPRRRLGGQSLLRVAPPRRVAGSLPVVARSWPARVAHHCHLDRKLI